MTTATFPPTPEPAPSVVIGPDGAAFRLVAVPVEKVVVAPAPPPKPITTTGATVIDMFRSKKFIAMLVGVLFAGLARVGLDISDETKEQVLNLVMVYIGAQGVADAGQGFAKARANQPPPAQPPAS